MIVKSVEQKPTIVEKPYEKDVIENKISRTKPSHTKRYHPAMPLISTLSILAIMAIGISRSPQNNSNLQRLHIQESKTTIHSDIKGSINRQDLLNQLGRLDLHGVNLDSLIISQELIDKLNSQINLGLIDEGVVTGLTKLQLDTAKDISNQNDPETIYSTYSKVEEIGQLLEALSKQADLQIEA